MSGQFTNNYETGISRVVLLDTAKWYDGDSMWLNVTGRFNAIHWQEFRLVGWDTPELRGAATSAYERAQGKEAGAFTVSWFLASADVHVYVKTRKDPEKYGRWLGDFWSETPSGVWISNLGEELAEAKLAVRYDPTVKGLNQRWRDVYDRRTGLV